MAPFEALDETSSVDEGTVEDVIAAATEHLDEIPVVRDSSDEEGDVVKKEKEREM